MTVLNEPASLEPIGPSMLVRWVMRPMTKVLNPVIRRLAGRRYFFMAGQIHHLGRRSGKTFVTPVGARRHEHSILIPLTFGNRSDWCRNVLAARGCVIRVGGQDYQASDPLLLGREAATPQVRAAFNPAERLAFRVLGIRQFMVLSAAAVSESR